MQRVSVIASCTTREIQDDFVVLTIQEGLRQYQCDTFKTHTQNRENMFSHHNQLVQGFSVVRFTTNFQTLPNHNGLCRKVDNILNFKNIGKVVRSFLVERAKSVYSQRTRNDEKRWMSAVQPAPTFPDARPDNPTPDSQHQSSDIVLRHSILPAYRCENFVTLAISGTKIL